MIDPTVRRCRADDADVAQLELLEREAREALVGQRGGDRWLVEHPPIGADWRERCSDADVWVAHIDDVVVGYMVAELGADLIVRIDQVWVTPLAREVGFGDALLEHGDQLRPRTRCDRGGGRIAARRSPDEEPLRAGRDRGSADHDVSRAVTVSDPSTPGRASR